MDLLVFLDRSSHIDQGLPQLPVRLHFAALDSIDGGLTNADSRSDCLLGETSGSEGFNGT